MNEHVREDIVIEGASNSGKFDVERF